MTDLSETSGGRGSIQTLLFAIHDVPFAVRSDDPATIAHVSRLVRRYRNGAAPIATGKSQVLVAVQGTPAFDLARLREVPRRNENKPSRTMTAEIDGGRVIYRRDTGVLTEIRPNQWTVTGDLRAHPGEVTRALDAMLSLALVERGYLTLKGSALVRETDGSGVALLGGADTARRALAVTLLAHGFRWVTEDLLLVRVVAGEIEMRGLPGLLRLGPAAMLAHPALTATLTDEERTRYRGQSWRELRELDMRYTVDAAEAFGETHIAAGGTLRTAVALRWRANDPADAPTLADLGRPDAYEMLAEATRSYGLYDLRGTLPPTTHRLSRLVATAEMYALTGPIAPEAAAARIAAAVAPAPALAAHEVA